jgi:hypothetical protein
MIGVCLASLWSISRLQANLNSILAENVTRLEAAADLEVKLRQLRFHTFMYVLDPSPNRQRLIDDDESGFESALAILRDSTTDPEERHLVEVISDGYSAYRFRLERSMAPMPEPRTREGFAEWADAHPVQPLIVPCQELMRRNRAAMEETAQESQRVSDRTRTAMTLLAVLGPFGGLVAGFGIARGLSRSIAQLRVQVEDVRAQLTEDVGTVRVKTDGGLIGLETEMGQVVSRVREVVEQAQRRERDALRAEQLAAVGQLAAGVAHEVRNPLMSMKLLTEAAIAGGEFTADDLRVIHEQIGRLERTVTGLLDFARPTPPRRELNDLREIVKAAVDLVHGRADIQNVIIEVRPLSDRVAALVRRPSVLGAARARLRQSGRHALTQRGARSGRAGRGRGPCASGIRSCRCFPCGGRAPGQPRRSPNR